MEFTQAEIAAVAEFVRGPYVVLGDGRIDCEIYTPRNGWVPHTSDPNDSSELCRLVYAYASTQL